MVRGSACEPTHGCSCGRPVGIDIVPDIGLSSICSSAPSVALGCCCGRCLCTSPGCPNDADAVGTLFVVSAGAVRIGGSVFCCSCPCLAVPAGGGSLSSPAEVLDRGVRSCMTWLTCLAPHWLHVPRVSPLLMLGGGGTRRSQNKILFWSKKKFQERKQQFQERQKSFRNGKKVSGTEKRFQEREKVSRPGRPTPSYVTACKDNPSCIIHGGRPNCWRYVCHASVCWGGMCDKLATESSTRQLLAQLLRRP